MYFNNFFNESYVSNQRSERREKQQDKQQRQSLYNVVQEWEIIEKERDLFRRLIRPKTRKLLRSVHLLNFYEKATSLRVIHNWWCNLSIVGINIKKHATTLGDFQVASG